MGERTGQVRIGRADGDDDERLPSIDESPSSRNRLSLETAIPVSNLSLADPQCTFLYMTKRRPDSQATATWMRKRLRDPNQKSCRQLVKTVSCDDLDKKSASGGFLMVGGCRLHR